MPADPHAPGSAKEVILIFVKFLGFLAALAMFGVLAFLLRRSMT